MRFRPVLLFLVACAATQAADACAQSAPAQAPKVAAAQTTIVYRNNVYGFCFVLPESWKGYTIVSEQWDGNLLSSGQTVYGPQFLIRNPKWSAANPYQDIPIMVFTPGEWQQVQAATLAVSAAPIGPSELGSNSKYVFALPPRWIGFTDTLGQDEVNAWMTENRLQAPCGHKPAKPTGNTP
jgi:hypothetical protein